MLERRSHVERRRSPIRHWSYGSATLGSGSSEPGRGEGRSGADCVELDGRVVRVGHAGEDGKHDVDERRREYASGRRNRYAQLVEDEQ
jgi:hypothetical protein